MAGQVPPLSDTASLREARACVRDQHHAQAKAAAAGRQPRNITERIIWADPAFRELVEFYSREARA